MPIVPTLQEQAPMGAAPGVRQSAAGATPDAFGAGVGRAVAGAGSQMVELAIRHQEEMNVIKSKDAYISAMGKDAELRAALNAKKGMDAVELGQEMIAGQGRGKSAWDEIRAEAIKDLNANQRQKFDNHWAPQQLASMQATGRYMTAQRGVHQDSQDMALVDMSAKAYQQTHHVEHLIEGKASLQSAMRRKGASADEIKLEQERWVTGQYFDTVSKRISEGNIKQATEFYEAHQKEIPAAQQKAFNNAIKNGERAAKQDQDRADTKAVAAAFDASDASLAEYFNALADDDVAKLPGLRAQANRDIQIYESTSKARGKTSGKARAEKMRGTLVAGERAKKSRTDREISSLLSTYAAAESSDAAAINNQINGWVSAIDADLRAGVRTVEQVYDEMLDLNANPDITPLQRRTLNRVYATGQKREADALADAGEVKPADRKNLLRELNGSTRSRFIELAGVDTVAELPSKYRIGMGEMMDEMERMSKAGKSSRELRDAYDEMMQPIKDKKTLDEATRNVFSPPVKDAVARDVDIPTSPADAALANEILNNLPGAPNQTTTPPKAPKIEERAAPMLQGLNAL